MTGEPVATTVRVDLSEKSYDIVIGSGLIGDAGARLSPILGTSRVIVITDENVAPHWLAPLEDSLRAHRIEAHTQILPAGERTKSMDRVTALTDWMLDVGVDRKTAVIALGGGVIGDLTGFCAAIALRGLPFIQIPTTLLAQVDSSVGGKTAVDSRHGKNLIGAFHQPRLVLADTDTLATLPSRQVRAGYAEVVKYGLINDLDFFEWCETHGRAVLNGDPAAIRRAVEVSCRAKAMIVAEDEREAGNRALLNLGHTFGHAFEAEAGLGNILLHGEAVAFGTLCAFDLSHRMKLCSGQEVARVRAHFADLGLLTSLDGVAAPSWTPDAIIGHMGKDKKAEAGRLTFILARGIGQSFICRDVAEDVLHAQLSDILCA